MPGEAVPPGCAGQQLHVYIAQVLAGLPWNDSMQFSVCLYDQGFHLSGEHQMGPKSLPSYVFTFVLIPAIWPPMGVLYNSILALTARN